MSICMFKVLDAFSSASLSAPGLQVNLVYEADQISNCYTTPATPRKSLRKFAITEVINCERL